MVFRRRTDEERAALKAEKAQRKAEARERIRSVMDESRREKNEQRTQVVTAMLQPDETVLAQFKTAEVLMAKFVVFTPKRVLVAPIHNPASAESIPYRSITSFAASNFVTKDIKLNVAGRRDPLDLSFDNADDRDRALALLNTHAI